jgi:hypothetical protein
VTYRERPRPAPEDDELVVVRSYFDLVEAGLARAALANEGIHAWVLESTSFNPLLSASAGGVAVQVRASDAEHAAAILTRVDTTAIVLDEDDEPEGSVRCPRCELPYCAFERQRYSSALAASPLSALLLLARFTSKPRWHCHKCLHVWDDPKLGPSRPTPLAEGVPRPVFRMHRPRSGMGFMVGCVLGALWLALFPGAGGSFLGLLSIVVCGWSGSKFGHDVCSEPACRAELPPGVDACPRCRGAIAGRIERAFEHYSAAADIRRELRALEAPRPPRGPAWKSGKKQGRKAPRKRPTTEG